MDKTLLAQGDLTLNTHNDESGVGKERSSEEEIRGEYGDNFRSLWKRYNSYVPDGTWDDTIEVDEIYRALKEAENEVVDGSRSVQQ